MISITKIKELIPNDKKTIIIGAICLLAIGLTWYLLGPVQHDRSGADQVRTDISAVEREQQAAVDRVERVENGLADSAAEAGRVSAGLGGVAEAVAGVESRIDSSQGKLAFEG